MKTKTRKSARILRAEGEITAEIFQKMVEEHDPTYMWSQNKAHIETEKEREVEIAKARGIIGDSVAIPIWNQTMRRKIVPAFVEEYLWSASPKRIEK